ncbi:MAG: DUF3570 domain-containing protein [Myxococcota bacterium]
MGLASWAQAPLTGLLASVLAGPAPAPRTPDTQGGSVETAGGLYVRSDTDHTTVVSPRVRVAVPFNEDRGRVDLVYAVDVWTSASVDVRTAASARVTEQRDEVDGSLQHAWGSTTAAVGYRFSHENDYVSNSGRASIETSLADKTITLRGQIMGGGDVVGRAGDVAFSRPIAYGGGFLSYTQVLTPTTVAALTADLRLQQGYLASPYRWVSLGGGGGCQGSAGLCIPEQHPGRRVRVASVARLVQALSPRWSLHLAYRLYGDSWRVLGHTGRATVRFAPRPSWSLGLELRGYTQRGAAFYRRVYGDSGLVGFVTRDRELGPVWNARAGLTSENRWSIGRRIELVLGGLVSAAHYRYPEFIGLTGVTAFELSTSLGVAL